MKSKRKIYFRADGNAQMGLGHVIRSLALVEMLQEDFECHFLIRNPLPALKQQILEVCQTIIELPDTELHNKEAQYIAKKYLTGNEMVVLDGYHFRTEYQRIIKNTGCKLVCIDDIHAYHFVADVVINHAGGITKNAYSAEPYTQFCLGLPYALLRKPFREATQCREYPDRDENAVFICLGGADPKNDTLRVLKKCEQIPNINKCYVVIGSAFPYKKELDAYLGNTSLSVEILPNLSASQMVKYMKKCGKAITSPSTISYEYLSVGGELYLEVIADNQADINEFFLKKGLAFPNEIFPTTNLKKKQNAFNIQEKTLDGNSNIRLLANFKNLS